MICREPGCELLVSKIAAASTIAIGAPTVAEAQLVALAKRGPDGPAAVERFLSEIQATVVPFGQHHLPVFLSAVLHYGKGRHPAALNMGDCFSYATAIASGMPLLFIGEDFRQTDIRIA